MAGSFSALLFHPLDLIRVRIVSQDGTDLRKHSGIAYRGFFHGARHITQTEGVAVLFRGAPLGLVASGVTWGLYLTLFRWFEAAALALMVSPISGQSDGGAQSQQQSSGDNKSNFGVSAVSSAGASVIVSFLTCPLFLIKTRMQLEDVKRDGSQPRINRSFYHGLRAAIERDGIRSLWRGFSAQLVMCCTMSIYMPLYETLRRPLCLSLGRDKLQWGETAAVTVAAKMGVTGFSHPVQLVKARLQDQRARIGDTKYASMRDAVRTVFHREGVRGFYRGVSVGLAQSTCRAVAQMICYERVLETVVTFRHSSS